MTVHAFVDESRRGRSYLLVAALVEPQDVARQRAALRSMLLPGQRELHFKKEKPQRRRFIASQLVKAKVRAAVYRRSCTTREEAARQDCLGRLVQDLCDLDARRLIIDSREGRDRHDERTVRAALGERPKESGLTYDHVVSTSEPLLWIADAVAWCYGADRTWRQRIAPTVATLTDLDRDVA